MVLLPLRHEFFPAYAGHVDWETTLGWNKLKYSYVAFPSKPISAVSTNLKSPTYYLILQLLIAHYILGLVAYLEGPCITLLLWQKWTKMNEQIFCNISDCRTQLLPRVPGSLLREPCNTRKGHPFNSSSSQTGHDDDHDSFIVYRHGKGSHLRKRCGHFPYGEPCGLNPNP